MMSSTPTNFLCRISLERELVLSNMAQILISNPNGDADADRSEQE